MDFESWDIDAETAFVVGRRLMEGEDIERDLAHARVLLQRAADAGHPLAASYLKRLGEMEPMSLHRNEEAMVISEEDDASAPESLGTTVFEPSEDKIDTEVRDLLAEVKQLQEEINKRLELIEKKL